MMKTLKYIPAAIVFTAIACYFLLICYSDMLFTAQDRNTFVASQIFFDSCMHRPFGLMQYVGSYLTQFFYEPTLGATLLMTIWVAIYAAGVKAFRLTSRWSPLFLLPLACLLTSIVDVGYWIYCINLPGYWFAQSVAYLLMLLLLWAFRCTPERWQSLWYILATLLFPLMGWTAMLMTVCMLIMQVVRRIAERRKGFFSLDNNLTAVGFLLAILSPRLIWYNILYSGMYLPLTLRGGFPIFENSTATSDHQSYPFYILVGLTMLFALFTYINIAWEKSKIITKLHINHIVITIPLAAIAYYGVNDQKFDDYNYLAEMRMTRATMNNDWKKVIDEKLAAETPSRTMVVLKNIALMNTGELGEKSFDIDRNTGIEINNPDSLNLNIMFIAGPVVYYNYGYVNYAIRWCMETAVAYGFSPYILKTMACSAKATGEKELEDRYTRILNKSSFYADWKAPAPSELVKDLAACQKDVLDSDENNCERYIIQNISNINGSLNPDVQNASLFYSILLRDAAKFWPAFVSYVATHKGQPLPKAYQEAYVMFEEMRPVEMSFNVDVPPTVRQNYHNFWAEGQGYAHQGMTKEQVAEMMLTNWGNTYWWFNAFGRELY